MTQTGASVLRLIAACFTSGSYCDPVPNSRRTSRVRVFLGRLSESLGSLFGDIGRHPGHVGRHFLYLGPPEVPKK